MSPKRLVGLAGTLLTALGLADCSGEPPGGPPAYADLFSRAFEPGLSVEIDRALAGEPKRMMRAPFRIFDAGRLLITSGRIKACDPFIGLDHPPFSVPVANGEFPVRLALVDDPLGGSAVAFARVDFSDAPVVLWSLAVAEGQEVSALKRGEIFGYPVDTGTGSFVDAEAALAMAREVKGNDKLTSAWIEDGARSAETKGNPRFHLVVPAGAGNIIMFDSGWGDGLYASWFGYAADGTVAALVTDFMVFDWAKAKF
jgi:hypothetical protein